MPDAIIVKPRHPYCPIKKGEHSSCATILIILQDGTAIVQCLAKNHPAAKNEMVFKPNNTQHNGFASVLCHVWSEKTWKETINKTFFMTYCGNSNIGHVVENEMDEVHVDFKKKQEVTDMMLGYTSYIYQGNNLQDQLEKGENQASKMSTKGKGRRRQSHSLSEEDSRDDDKEPALWITTNPWKKWLTWNNRRRYASITFNPVCHPREDTSGSKGKLNMWRGFALNPKPSDNPAPLIRQLIQEYVCSGNSMFNEFILDYCASLVQHPGKKLGVAIVLHGIQGTGKTTFTNVLTSIFGRYASDLVNTHHFTGRFNYHNKYKVLLILNEAVWGMIYFTHFLKQF